MYTTIRILIILPLLFIFLKKFILKNKKNKFNKKYVFIIAVVLIIVMNIVQAIPVENLFIKFPSPEAAFKYTLGNKDIIQVIKDNNYAFVIYWEKANTVSYDAFDYRNGGWKLPVPYGIMPKVTYKDYDKYQIFIYGVNNYNKKLLTVKAAFQPSTKIDANISDNRNSKFKIFFTNAGGNEFNVYSCAIIDSNDKDYRLNINGESINID